MLKKEIKAVDLRMNNSVKALAIWGLGREGKAVFEQRVSLFPNLESMLLIDEADGAVSPDWAEGFAVVSSKVLAEQEVDLLVRSAGVSPYKEEIEAFKKRGGSVKSVSTLWFEQNPEAKTICITGTKGKSTTSKLVWHFLKELGFDAALGGNIGVPLLELAKGKDWYVIELSSYQTSDFCGQASLGVVLNLFEDHISWHGSVNRYHQDKLNLLKQSDRMLIGEQVDGHSAYASLTVNAQIIEQTSRWTIEGNQLVLGEEALDLEGVSLKGHHNLVNLRAAMEIVKVVAGSSPVSPEQWSVLLESYEPLPYRLEEVGSKDGQLYVCDPLSTNAASTVASLKAYQGRKVALLVGGLDRQQDLSELVAYLKNAAHVVAVIGLPKTGWELVDSLKASGKALVKVSTIEAMLLMGEKMAEAEVVLFSPAAASLNAGETYVTRGDEFKALV